MAQRRRQLLPTRPPRSKCEWGVFFLLGNDDDDHYQHAPLVLNASGGCFFFWATTTMTATNTPLIWATTAGLATNKKGHTSPPASRATARGVDHGWDDDRQQQQRRQASNHQWTTHHPPPASRATARGVDHGWDDSSAAMSPEPPPLTRKREVGVFLCSFYSGAPPRHHYHPLSLANASWGWLLVCFSRNGRHVTSITPSRLQTRGGGVSLFVSLRSAATSPLPPPLARKREVGVFLCSFYSGAPPRHHYHPLSLANASWGWFLVCFSRNGRHVTSTTPPRSQTRVGGSFLTHDGQYITTTTPPRSQSRVGGGSLLYLDVFRIIINY
jgi:hypothetical protein